VPDTLLQRDLQTGSPEADLLFSTARVHISEDAAQRIRSLVREDLNWITLIQMAMQHGTTALLYFNLQRICPEVVPQGVLKPLAARYTSQVSEAQHRSEELVRILAALEGHGVFAVAYKGPILSQRLYGSVGLREFSKSSDLDILVHECDLPRAKAIIVDQGYDEDSRTEREWIFRHRDRGRFLELQWHFTTHLCRVSDDPGRFLQRFETVPFADAAVRSLPLEVYFLVLCLHATKHKWRTLKLICDIAEILASPAVDWEYVLREANALGIKRVLALGVLLSEDPIGVSAPPSLLGGLKIDRAARELAAQCREELLKEPDDNWRLHADIRFMLKVRERRYDEMKVFFGDWLWPETMPDDDDRRFLSIPGPLSALYYVVRPMRLVWKEISER
jgi:hypothetical protein